MRRNAEQREINTRKRQDLQLEKQSHCQQLYQHSEVTAFVYTYTRAFNARTKRIFMCMCVCMKHSVICSIRRVLGFIVLHGLSRLITSTHAP